MRQLAYTFFSHFDDTMKHCNYYSKSLDPMLKTFDLNMSQPFSLLSTGIGNEGRFAMSPKFEIRRQKQKGEVCPLLTVYIDNQ